MENLCRGYPQRRRERVAAGLVGDCVPISANRRKCAFRKMGYFCGIKNRHSLPNLRVRTFQKHIYKSVMVKFRFPTCKTHEENSKTSLVISLPPLLRRERNDLTSFFCGCYQGELLSRTIGGCGLGLLVIDRGFR